MQTLIGSYECKADVKGRLMLPVGLKKQLASSLSSGFVLKRAVFQPCLELYSLVEWKSLMQKVNKLNRFKKKNNDFIRAFTAGVRFIELDASGRILIPKELIAIAGITKDVILTSAVNIIEIWDKDKYEKAINDASSDFAVLAEDVMGQDESYGLS